MTASRSLAINISFLSLKDPLAFRDPVIRARATRNPGRLNVVKIILSIINFTWRLIIVDASLVVEIPFPFELSISYPIRVSLVAPIKAIG